MAIHVLYVDDNPHDRELVRDALENEGEARAKAKSQKASRKKPSD